MVIRKRRRRRRMQFGISLIEATLPYSDDVILAALDKFIDNSGGVPVYFPIWSRLGTEGRSPTGREFPELALLEKIRSRGVNPAVYAETPGVPFTDILAGKWDDYYARFADDAGAYGQKIIYRWNQEMNDLWPEPTSWQVSSADLFKDTFRYVSEAIRVRGGADNVLMFYCPMARANNKLEEISRYFPGDDWVQRVGFDVYERETAKPIDRNYKVIRTVNELRRISDRRIIVGETGIAEDITGGKSAWLKSWLLSGVHAVIYFNMRLGTGTAHAWRFNRSMEDTYGGLMRA